MNSSEITRHGLAYLSLLREWGVQPSLKTMHGLIDCLANMAQILEGQEELPASGMPYSQDLADADTKRVHRHERRGRALHAEV